MFPGSSTKLAAELRRRRRVAITADVRDMAGLQAALASPSPELAAAMERHGVIPPFAAHIEK